MPEPTPTPQPNVSPKQPFYKHHRFPLVIVALAAVTLIGLFVYNGFLHKPRKVAVRPPSLAQVTKGQSVVLSALNAQLATNPSAQEQKQFTDTAKARLNNIKKLLNNEQVKEVLAMAKPGGFKNAPKEARSYLEKKAILKGKLHLLHGEKRGKNGQVLSDYHEYHVGGSQLADTKQLYLTDELPFTYANTDVRAQTIQFGEVYATDNDALMQTSPAPPILPAISAAPTTKTDLVVLVNFTSNTAKPVSTAQAESTFFTASNSINQYYQAATNGNVSLTGTTAGYFTINYNTSTCDMTTLATLANNAAAQAGVILANYRYHTYIFPSLSACNFGGLASVGSAESWLNGGTYSAIHELGHNFGVLHSGTLSCTSSGQPVALSNSCSSNEYGDPFSPMGACCSVLHMMEHLNEMGFIDPSQAQTVTSSGTYTLAGTRTSGSPQLIMIKRSASTENLPRSTGPGYYLLEYRQPKLPFDNFGSTQAVVNGISIRVGGPGYNVQNPGGGDDALLIDTTPLSAVNFYDGALGVNQTFSDPANGITIKTLSVTPGGNATVQISMPNVPCVKHPPGAGLSPTFQTGAAGQAIAYFLGVGDADTGSCPSQTVTVTPNMPPGFTTSLPQFTVTLNPGQFIGTYQPIITSPISAPVGDYTLKYTATSSQGSSDGIAFYTVTSSNCTRAAPTVSTIPTSQASLSGPGKTLSYNVSVHNNDSSGCDSTSFSLGAPGLPSGFTQTVTGASSVTLSPGGNGTITINVTSSIYVLKSTNNSFTENITDPNHSNSGASAIYSVPATWPFLVCGHC